jgi:hypothetical protein
MVILDRALCDYRTVRVSDGLGHWAAGKPARGKHSASAMRSAIARQWSRSDFPDTPATDAAAVQLAGLAVEVGMLREQLGEARQDRDRWRDEASAWRDQAQRLALPALPKPEPEPASWWRWLRSTE